MKIRRGITLKPVSGGLSDSPILLCLPRLLDLGKIRFDGDQFAVGEKHDDICHGLRVEILIGEPGGKPGDVVHLGPGNFPATAGLAFVHGHDVRGSLLQGHVGPAVSVDLSDPRFMVGKTDGLVFRVKNDFQNMWHPYLELQPALRERFRQGPHEIDLRFAGKVIVRKEG